MLPLGRQDAAGRGAQVVAGRQCGYSLPCVVLRWSEVSEDDSCEWCHLYKGMEGELMSASLSSSARGKLQIDFLLPCVAERNMSSSLPTALVRQKGHGSFQEAGR